MQFIFVHSLIRTIAPSEIFCAIYCCTLSHPYKFLIVTTSSELNLPIRLLTYPGSMLFYPLPDDSLNQLQSIRESLMQMKSPTNQNFSALNTMVSGEMGEKVEPNSITQICRTLDNRDCPPTDEQLAAILVVSVAARPGD